MNILLYLQYTLGILVAFGLVIFIHEFGHFIVAKKSGIKVEQFSFGFGKEIFGFQWGETRYTVNWIPLGGFVRMAGEVPEDYQGPVMEGASRDQNQDRSRDFMTQPWYKRISVALAGPVMNYALAILLFFAIFMVWGQPIHVNKTEVGDVMVGMPAEKAGIKPGDKILKVAGQSVEDFLTVSRLISERANQKVELVVDRQSKEMKFEVTPAWNEEAKRGLIGISPAQPVLLSKKVTVTEAFSDSLKQCWFISAATLQHLADKIRAGEKPDVAGPIGIGQFIVKAVKSGMKDYLTLIALISVALGLFNLFPIPLLDGGHVVYYLIEGIRGKPVSSRVMARANAVGLALLLSLFALATFNDVTRKVDTTEPSKQDGQKK